MQTLEEIEKSITVNITIKLPQGEYHSDQLWEFVDKHFKSLKYVNTTITFEGNIGGQGAHPVYQATYATGEEYCAECKQNEYDDSRHLKSCSYWKTK